MIELKGKYNYAKIYTDYIGEKVTQQIIELLNQEFIKDSIVRIMPDCHYGKGCVIGTTITIKDKIVPSLVGVDIGCGMLLVELGNINIDFPSLDNYIYKNIPSGNKIYDNAIDKSINLEELKCFDKLKKKNHLYKSLGTLGGGNHFIEIDKDEDDNKYLIIHTGSRNLGAQVAKYYQDQAIKYHKDKIFNKKEAKEKIIEECKKQGKQKEIEAKLKHIDNLSISTPMPYELCYLENELFDDYLYDMNITQKFATKNREIIATKIVEYLGLDFKKLFKFETVHNYINMKDLILRKGSISAYQDEIVLIPINMRDGCIIGKGKSNVEFNYSAPHGAGRVMSRFDAYTSIDLKDYQESMKGIYTTSVDDSTIDESPFAYKPIESIINNIHDTVEIIKIIKPVYNYKHSKLKNPEN